jgi:hypothetical protein
LGRFAVALVVLVVAAGCARGEPDPGAVALPSLPTVPVAGPGSTVLDPALKEGCDAVWAVATFVYAATVTTGGVAEREELREGIAQYEPVATARVPALAGDVALLASHGGWVLDSGARGPAPADAAAASERVVSYLRGTCHLQMG